MTNNRLSGLVYDAAGNGVVVAGSSQSTQTQWTFSPPSFTSAGTSLANGLNAGDVNNNPLITLYQYDGLGNLTCVEQHGGVMGTGCSSSPTNDATSPWRVRRFTYDSVGRLLTAKNPESGTISYSYDNDSNLLQKTSPAPNQTGSATQTISYCYDELHRVTGRAYGALSCPLASPVVSYAYDLGTNAKGKLTSMADQAGSATYSYDILGRLSTETRSLIGANNALIPKTLSYEYNLDGSLAKLHYPSGAVVTYTPDSAGRVTQAVDSGNGINYVTAATYDATSALTGFISGSGGVAAITNTFTYSKRLQPVTMSATTPSQTVFSIGYDFHLGNGDNGNVFGITNYKDTSRNQTFTYDPLNRLISAQNAGTNCAATTANGKTEYWGNSYSYDAWGNLLGKTVTKCGAENLSVTADAHNWLHISPNDYQYDVAGNMTFDTTENVNLSYDQENRITGAAGHGYIYDGDGNRVEKVTPPTNPTSGMLYWYMKPGIVAESDLAGTLKSEYVFFDGSRVARKDFPGNTVTYYFSDNLKTASVIADAGGMIKAESDYYPWGGEIQFVNNDSNDYKFTGKKRDAETGLDYFGARYYSNELGRWISADWSATPVPVPYADFADPQTLSLYSYVRALPTTKADIDGHGWWEKFKNSMGTAHCWCEGAEAEESRRKLQEQGEANVLAMQIALHRPENQQTLVMMTLVALGETLPGQTSSSTSGQTVEETAPGEASAAQLQGAANRAATTIGPGKGPVHGTAVHSEFAAEVNSLGKSNLSTEVSYKNGVEVPRGTPGSIRVDVVEGQKNAPTAAYDLKTGDAKLTPARTQQIQSHIPGGSRVPVKEIKPQP